MLKKFKTGFPGNKNSRPVLMCKNCYAFYYKNSWNFKKPSYLNQYKDDEEIAIRFLQCGACIEQENALFEQVV